MKLFMLSAFVLLTQTQHASAKGFFLPKTLPDDGTSSTSYSAESSYAPSYGDQPSVNKDPGNLAFQGKYALYSDPRAGRGICMSQPSGSAESVLSRNGITATGNPTSAEKSALAKGIGQVEKLLGRPLPASWRTSYYFVSEEREWAQRADAIYVRRGQPGNPKGLLTGRMMHELGHKVGNSGQYGKYLAAMGGQTCGISPYAKKKANECFAEVFEAYVTFPDLLKRQCPRAYNFFADQLFPGSARKVATCGGNNPNTMLAEANSNSRTRSRSEASAEGNETPRRPASRKTMGGRQ